MKPEVAMQSERLIVVLLALGSAGCGSPDELLINKRVSASDVSPSDALDPSEPLPVPVQRPSEAPLQELQGLHQGFAGYFCEDGNLVVQVVGGSDTTDQLDAARYDEILQSTAPACRSARTETDGSPTVSIRSANYTFSQLASWRDALYSTFLDDENAVSLAIDYKMNRVAMGVLPGNTPVGDAASASLELPADAYYVFEQGEVTPQGVCFPGSPTDIRFPNCFRPTIPGGVELMTCTNGGCNGSPGSQTGGCTISAPGSLWENGSLIPGYVTNAHCIPPYYSMESRYVYQPLRDGLFSTTNMIGFEFIDPPGWLCGWRRCRYSDSAWIRAFTSAFGGGSPELGKIAKPTNYNGSTAMNPSNSRFTIIGWMDSVQGMTIDKVGIREGWQYGTVQSVCSDVNLGTSQRFVCQGSSNIVINTGDSGSPVFLWTGNVDATLLGTMWASSSGGAISYYSPWYNIRLELGDLTIN